MFTPFCEDVRDTERKESNGPHPGKRKSGGGGPDSEQTARKLRSAASGGWDQYSPGVVGVGTASSKRGEIEPVIRCVAGGQDA